MKRTDAKLILGCHGLFVDEWEPGQHWTTDRFGYVISIGRDGYSRMSDQGVWLRLHRVTYVALIEDLGSDQHLKNLCGIRHCFNPYHWAVREPVTHCPRGHLRSGRNLGERNVYGFKRLLYFCKQCNRDDGNRRYARNKAGVENLVTSSKELTSAK